jgi:hypothetical protein
MGCQDEFRRYRFYAMAQEAPKKSQELLQASSELRDARSINSAAFSSRRWMLHTKGARWLEDGKITSIKTPNSEPNEPILTLYADVNDFSALILGFGKIEHGEHGRNNDPDSVLSKVDPDALPEKHP